VKPVITIRLSRPQSFVVHTSRVRHDLLACLASLSFLLSVPALGQTAAPAPLPPDAAEAIKKGILAAKQQDYLLAIRFFQEARKPQDRYQYQPDAPEIYFNLGLAESKIPGRELRAIAWFGAYLAANPNASNAGAVKDLMNALNVKCQSNILHLIQTAQDAAIKIPIGEGNAAWPGPDPERHNDALGGVAALWAEFGDFENANRAIGMRIGNGANTEEPFVRIRTDLAVDKADVGDIAGAQRDAKLLPADSSDRVYGSIAATQAETGDISGALSTVDSIQRTSDKNWVLGQIAHFQAKAGDTPSALKTIELNPHLDGKSSTLKDIAIYQVTNGDIGGALQTASLIDFSENKDDAYSSIAQAQIQAGDIADALNSVRLMKSVRLKSNRLVEITESEIKAGDIGAAQKTVDLIEVSQSDSKIRAQVAIAEGQLAVGNIADAQKTLAAAQAIADALSADSGKYALEVSIARAQADAGEIPGAFKTTDSISDPEFKSFALEQIVEAQAKSGDILSAQKTVELLRNGSDANGRKMAQAYIAIGQTEAGNVNGALKTADSIQDAAGKSYALQYILIAQLKAGDFADALQSVNQIEDAKTKSWAQSAIDKARAKASEKENPPAVVNSAKIKSIPHYAIPVVPVLDWLRRLDDDRNESFHLCALNTAPFLDLASYLRTLPPSDNASTVFIGLSGVVQKIIDAHQCIDTMLKKQARQRREP